MRPTLLRRLDVGDVLTTNFGRPILRHQVDEAYFVVNVFLFREGVPWNLAVVSKHL